MPSIEKAGFAYAFDIPDEALYAVIDTGQMSRVFYNLADNAIRYNPKGTVISVSLSRQPEEVVILFCDDGIGIPVAAAKDIFKPFVRMDDSRTGYSRKGWA